MRTSKLCILSKDRSSPLSIFEYLLGLVFIIGSAYSQYIVGRFGFWEGTIMVYGLPILLVSIFFGRKILSCAFFNNSKALGLGLAYFGIFSVLSYLAGFFILLLINQINPDSASLFRNSDPPLHINSDLIWLMIPFSFLVIGPAEEYLFRGFIFGGLLNVFRKTSWVVLAIISSVLFAAAHFYYFQVFGIVSSIIFVDIFAMGMAMSISYYYSGGNLLIPSVLHGLFDATAFLSIATQSNVGVYLRIFLVVLGVGMAAFFAVRYLYNKYFVLSS